MSQEIVGTWKLVEWAAEVDGRPRTPFGGETTGLITYTSDGRMWGTLMRVNRPLVDGDTLAAASESERAAAAAGYLNYAGTYRLEGSTVVHEVEVSLFPNWIGTDQVREMQWAPNGRGGHDLLLSAQSTSRNGEMVTNSLIWRRLEDWDS